MSRRSIDRRMDAVRDALLPPGSMARRLHDLGPADRMRYELWRGDVAQAARRYSDGAERYAALIDGTDVMPAMPIGVALSLGIDPRADRIPADITLDEIADRYRALLEEGNER